MLLKVFILLLTIYLIIVISKDEKEILFSVGYITFVENKMKLKVEISVTDSERAKGLMDREYLALDKGMLFIFENEVKQRVWMNNTLIPLDVLFIAADERIVSIIKNLQPCYKKPCTIYTSEKKAKYMLEVNAGLVDKKTIKLGQKLVFNI